MRINKALRVSAVVLSASLVLAGCGSDTPAPQPTDSAKLEGTLTFANWQWLEPGRGDLILAAAQGYSAVNAGATIEKQEITRADYEKTISTQIGGGQGPDIFIIPDPFFPELVEAGALEPLDDVVKGVKGLRESNENYTDSDGKQMSILWEAVPYSLAYNKAILADAGVEAPTTVDELVAASNKIKEVTGKTGFVVRHQMNEESPWWTDYSNWVFGFGGGYSDGSKLTLDKQENIDALTALQKVYNSAGFGVGDDASTYRSRFAAGEIGMIIDNSSAVLTTVSKADGIKPEDIGSVVLPFPKGGSAYAGFSIGINANSTNKELAKDFLKWMLTEDSQKVFVDALFPSGIATEVTPSASIADKHEWVDAFYEQLKDSSSVVIPGFEAATPQIRTVVLTEVARTLSSGADPKEAMEAAQKNAASIK